MSARFPLSNSLRVIGQLLEQQGLDVFDIVLDEDQFAVQCGDPVAPYLDIINLNYTLAQLQALDQQAKRRRQPCFSLVGFDGLPETLRAIGRHVDQERAELLRICNASASFYEAISIEYRTSDRRRREEEIPASALHDHAMRMYKERSSINPR